ncbi:DUF1990 family protein [Actinomadura rubrobrunea]|uniref:DUF1990 family protein n=1 Tax=Actinomadura rubrobrunea TaxID=115335 RepID=UPI0009FC7C92|nr:DUF1990 family protein [Actinomadura rubrobrunea]
MSENTREERRLRRLHAELRHRTLNFDPARPPEKTGDAGWRVDDYRQPLPAEPPGPPLPDGSWAIARRLVRDYQFADPAIIRRVCGAGRPEPGRDMLLDARFYGLRFPLGVRVGEVIDGVVEEDGRRARVWGWNYRTLEGHLERGQMDHQVRKWLDTGEVEFRVHAYSQAAPIANPVVRLGFTLFGRVMQVRYHRRACRRMEQLTTAALAERRRAAGKGAE